MNKQIESIMEERKKQNEKWGVQLHDPMTWLAILTEEVGEASQAALHDVYGGSHAGTFRKEIVQIAAVCVQILEHIDGNSIQKPSAGTVGICGGVPPGKSSTVEGQIIGGSL